MTTRRTLTGAAALATAGVLVAGAVAGASGASAAGGRSVTTYTIEKGTKAVHGPSHLAPGYAGIHVDGPQDQLLQLVKTRHSGVGKNTVVKDFALSNKGKPAAFEADFKAVGGALNGKTMYVDLDPGTYFAFDENTSALSKSAVQTIHVAGARSNAARPSSAGTITTVGDMMFSGKPKSIGTSGYLTFANRSKKNANNTHFIVLEKLKNGKTLADVKKVFAGKEKPSDVLDAGRHKQYLTGVLSFGKTERVSYTLVPGTYFLACFFPDRATGQPHAFMGMYRTITVG